MDNTKIEWADSTWNPMTGCTNNCDYCYARRIAERFTASEYAEKKKYLATDFTVELENPYISSEGKREPYPYGFIPTLHKYRLEDPKRKTKPRNMFCCSMGGLFEKGTPIEWPHMVFLACWEAAWHTYLFLTKNLEGIDKAIDYHTGEERGCEDAMKFFENIWFGTTVTCKGDQERIQTLSKIEEGHKFLSFEPLHGPVELNLKRERCPVCGSSEIYQDNPKTSGLLNTLYCADCADWESPDGDSLKSSIEWVIIGAESGIRKGRVIPRPEWVLSIVEQCKPFGIPILMKDSLIPIIGERNMLREFPEALK